ncbi:MAG TPA: carbohydrate kinase [Thermoanaerobaculia bacterium]
MKTHIERPLVVGAGLVALDVIHDTASDLIQHRAGGTCGNVLTILSYLGWRAIPLARLRRDAAFNILIDDLRRWGVTTDYLQVAQDAATPVIVELLKSGPDGVNHRFLLRCPSCGTRLPSYRPLTLKNVEVLPDHVRRPDVFFFDRTSPAARALAKEASRHGALVVFEPSSAHADEELERTTEVIDVLKVAADRVPDEVLSCIPTSVLVIQTLGSSGIRFRPRSHSRWFRLGANPVRAIRDLAGAGDWCAAGILSQLRDHERLDDSAYITEAVNYGQALAAWTCGFVGPRGGMYEQSKEQFEDAVASILASRVPRGINTKPKSEHNADEAISCSECAAEIAGPPRAHRRSS